MLITSQNFLETAEDEEATASGVKRYRLGEGGVAGGGHKRKRNEPLIRINPRVILLTLPALSDEENELLYLQSYQFILHGQVKSLIKLGLPTELEVFLFKGFD